MKNLMILLALITSNLAFSQDVSNVNPENIRQHYGQTYFNMEREWGNLMYCASYSELKTQKENLKTIRETNNWRLREAVQYATALAAIGYSIEADKVSEMFQEKFDTSGFEIKFSVEKDQSSLVFQNKSLNKLGKIFLFQYDEKKQNVNYVKVSNFALNPLTNQMEAVGPIHFCLENRFLVKWSNEEVAFSEENE